MAAILIDKGWSLVMTGLAYITDLNGAVKNMYGCVSHPPSELLLRNLRKLCIFDFLPIILS